MSLVRSFFSIFAVNIFIVSVLFAVLPAFRNYLFREDGLIENLTAAIFLSAFYVSMYFIVRKGKRQLSLVLISLVGLVGFLDEVSFGERHFNLTMPRYDGVKFDAVHDGLFWGYLKLAGLIAAHPDASLLVFSVILAAVLTGAVMARERLVDLVGTIRREQKRMMVVIFFLLLGTAMLVDLDFIENDYLYYMEEMFEMFAGVALIFCALSRVNSSTVLDRASAVVLSRISDGLAVFTACLMATWIRFESGYLPVFHDPPPPYSQYVFGSIFVSITMVLMMYVMKTYDALLSKRVVIAVLGGLAVCITLIYLSGTQPPPSRLVLGLLLVMIPVFIFGARLTLSRLLKLNLVVPTSEIANHTDH